jgi:hypothetical protein
VAAIRIVLVAVLEVEAPFLVIEPRREFDGTVRHLGESREARLELGLHAVPVPVDVVIAPDDDELIPGRDEIGEALHDARVMIHDEPELGEAVVGSTAEAVRDFLCGRFGDELVRFGHHAHAGKIDEIAPDDEPPGSILDPMGSVPVEQRGKVAVALHAQPSTERRVGKGV